MDLLQVSFKKKKKSLIGAMQSVRADSRRCQNRGHVAVYTADSCQIFLNTHAFSRTDVCFVAVFTGC